MRGRVGVRELEIHTVWIAFTPILFEFTPLSFAFTPLSRISTSVNDMGCE